MNLFIYINLQRQWMKSTAYLDQISHHACCEYCTYINTCTCTYVNPTVSVNEHGTNMCKYTTNIFKQVFVSLYIVKRIKIWAKVSKPCTVRKTISMDITN